LKKWILSLVVFVVSIAVTAIAGFFLGIFLVGPHSDTLPRALQVPVGLGIWAGVLGIPIWLSYKTFTIYKSRENET